MRYSSPEEQAIFDKQLSESEQHAVRITGALPSAYLAAKAAEGKPAYDGPRELTPESVAARMGVKTTA